MARKGGAPENLKPIKSKEEAKKRGSNGGKKSGEVRRRKRDAREAAKLILDLPCSDAMKKNLKAMSVDEADFSNRVALFARAYVLAIGGDVNAMKFIIETSGETPKQQLEERRFENELGQQEGSNNAVDDWVNSIPDVLTEEEDTNGDIGTGKKA